jgi:membrane peptidoglycan carboxypeptidase
MKDAVLPIEDARFYEHGGVDYKGMVRAGLANLNRVKSQGASTITMQVARNVYLSSEKTLTRKIYEVLLTFKLEHLLSKDQILEIYMNQIYLGNRAYGFAAASEAYFGKPLKELTIAEAAMLAGLPKAPAPTTRSTTRSAPAAPATSSSAWRRTASSPPSRRPPPRRKNFTCATPPTTAGCTPSTSPKPCAS